MPRETPALQRALWKAREEDEDVKGFAFYPMMERPYPNNPNQVLRVYNPLSFKTLKELKTACSMYGPTYPFVLALLENIGNIEAMSHHLRQAHLDRWD